MGHEPVQKFEQWYEHYDPTGGRDGELEFRNIAPCGDREWREFGQYKNEMDRRVANYGKLEKIADGEVLTRKPDLPNISSGETSGLVRRIARNLVQNCPNVEVISCYDDDQPRGIFARHILTSKIIGSDQYSNDMQQNLFSSVKTALTLGFAAVAPVLLQDAKNGWYMKYDAIGYRDVFPEPGCKDIRDATKVYVRRYLTRGEAVQLVLNNAPGWDHHALRLLLKNPPRSRDMQSVSHQDAKHHQVPDGYEIITRYTNDGQPFLTFSANTKLLLRIETNKHPLKQHPVHFLVLEKDDQQPLGKSQVELLLGRQEFQDLMLNGAMKLWYRNINPSIIGYGAPNAIPNLSPGKYTSISNPNAKVEAFEVNTQTLMQYGTISEQNLGSMVSMVGAADQQMAMQANGGMSATPQGVEAQQAMVDITTNNYQKAIESFFSHYCSYALTMFFQELRAVQKVRLTADARMKLLEAGFPVENLNNEYKTVDGEDGEKVKVIEKYGDTLDLDFEEMAVEYWVRCVPGSLVELEDEKQLRVLKELFVPLSQAMPALAATQDQRMLTQATATMTYIIEKMIRLSGAAESNDLARLMGSGDFQQVDEKDKRIAALEEHINNVQPEYELEQIERDAVIQKLQENQSQMAQNMQLLLEKLGVVAPGSTSDSATTEEPVVSEPVQRVEEPYGSPANA